MCVHTTRTNCHWLSFRNILQQAQCTMPRGIDVRPSNLTDAQFAKQWVTLKRQLEADGITYSDMPTGKIAMKRGLGLAPKAKAMKAMKAMPAMKAAPMKAAKTSMKRARPASDSETDDKPDKTKRAPLNKSALKGAGTQMTVNDGCRIYHGS